MSDLTHGPDGPDDLGPEVDEVSGSVQPPAPVVPTAPDPNALYDEERISVVEKVDRYADLVLDDDEPLIQIERRDHFVVAVMVAHDGERWLPPAMATVDRLTRPPDLIVAVDTGSSDRTSELLRDWLGDDGVVLVPTETSFGEAVAAGIERADELMATGRADAPREGEVEWIWTLHDDCAPASDALQALLDGSDQATTAAILGPKVLGWHDRRLLLEAGVTIANSGRRITGLERGEHDQGQHDGLRDVLSVGSAGMLVRRDVWQVLGGFDPELPMFRDDLDLGWRANEAGYRVMVATDAVVHHAEAGIFGRRQLDAVDASAARADRQSAMHVLLAHARGWALPLLLIRLAVGSLARGVGLLLAKAPDEAAHEFGALGALLLSFRSIGASRRRVAHTRELGPGDLRHLRPRLGSQMRHASEAVIGLITGSSGTTVTSSGAASAGPSEDEAFDTSFDDSSGRLAFWLKRPALVLALLLALVSLVSARTWFGTGLLEGGALLPAPPGFGDLWSTYSQGWHAIGPGAATAAPPYLMVIAGVAAAMFGSATRAVDSMLMVGIPIAAVVMYLALRRIVRSRLVRVVAAAAYALLPAAIGAVSTGRLGTVMFLILLPALIRVCLRAPVSWRSAWGGALLVAVMTAFVPLTWLLVLVGVVAALVVARGVPAFAADRIDDDGDDGNDAGGRRVLDPASAQLATAIVAVDFRSRPVQARLIALVLTPLLLLLPWSIELIAHPSAWLLQAGLPGPVSQELPPWQVALLSPGGAGMPPLWITAGILALGVGGLVRRRSRPVATIAWIAVVAGLAIGVLQTLLRVRPPSETLPVLTWPGPATIVIGLGLLVAGAAAADGIEVRLARDSFSWRQPAAVIAVVAAALAPLVAGGWWMWRGVGDTVVRGDGSAVPAFVAAESLGPDMPRSLVFRPSERGIEYALVDGEGPRLGAAESGPPSQAYDQLNGLVADLMAGRGGGEVDGLGRYGVRFVVLAEPSPELVSVLDSEPGLRRISSAEGDTLWRLDTESARVRAVASKPALTVIPAQRADGALVVDEVLPKGMPPSSTVVLSERADSGWRATLNGEPLDVSDDSGDGWRQAFVLPSGSGTLRVWFDQESRHRWLWLQGALVALVIVLALPGRRRPVVDPDADVVGLDDDGDTDGAVNAQVSVDESSSDNEPASDNEPVSDEGVRS